MSGEQYNSDELVPPSFLNETYIVDVLRQVEDDPELHVINYEIKPGSKAGEHYASIMFKILVTYGSKGKVVSERRLILKTVPEAEGPKKELLENLPAFRDEIAMYTKVLPEMEKILHQHGEKGWWPKLVYSQTKPFVLIFDDLTVENYEVVIDPLDYDHIEIIVEKIAKYHALSKVIIEAGHVEFKSFNMVIREEMRPMFDPIVRVATHVCGIVKTSPGFEELAAKIETNYLPRLFESQMKTMSKDNSKEFTVLNHGDFHIRNLMFKRSSTGELTDVLFLDFQLPRYNMPAFDLIGLLTTMGTEEVRHRDADLIKMYHKHLSANLKTYGFTGDLPTVIDIHSTLLRMSGTKFFYMLCLGPVFRLRGYELSLMFDPKESGKILEALTDLLKDPVVMNDIKLELTKLDNIGLFEVCY